MLASCAPMSNVSGRLEENGLLVDTDAFRIVQNGKTTAWRAYIVVRNEALKFPVCIYRFSENDYSALWMQCAHQGAEVQVAGDYLHCPAHGSEYDNRGRVTNGPAETNLRTFPVSVSSNQLFIDLRKR
ncbi:putative Rieske iron-sulfur protein [Flavihumibacter petaseus NBRC 106054]|uniref:Putative Rieske iron-sulfur protein n=2 Tax=Flavihumibacter TaxID=1004301 RepID=A0A0E9MY44_9BACT|nr:putative Rieske iron-sulfur protein [Flavihumibacter petaseus NBRC 106054]